MRILLTNFMLAVLAGAYAIRASWFLFTGYVSPLTPVAAIAMVFCIFLFHRPPLGAGAWLYFVLAACVIAAIVNAALLFADAPAYRAPTNMMFSLVSALCWIGLAISYATSGFSQSSGSA